MRALVIEPGHGSLWLDDARFEGGRIIGTAWDESGRGSPLLPDDFRGEPVTLNFPRSHLLKVEGAATSTEQRESQE